MVDERTEKKNRKTKSLQFTNNVTNDLWYNNLVLLTLIVLRK